MYVEINNKKYEVIINYKNNKNMYLRVKEDLKIYIYAPKFIFKKDICNFINNNYKEIEKIISKYESKNNNSKFYYLGKPYDIIYTNTKEIFFTDNKIFIGKNANLNKYLLNDANNIFLYRLNYYYNLFEENIIYPKLKIRKMKTRWGVCNRKTNTITLNFTLINNKVSWLNYVIVHELSHFLAPNHQKEFWYYVNKYYPNYKEIRKEMRK